MNKASSNTDPELSKETNRLLDQYFDAAANLYGIIPLHILLKIYNSQNEPISEEAFLKFVDNIDFDIKHYLVIGEEDVFPDKPKTEPMKRDLVTEYLYILDFDEYLDVKEEQFGKPYYIPDKKQLLKHTYELYFEKTLEFIELRAFLRSLPYIEKENADNLAVDIQMMISLDRGDCYGAVNEALSMGVDLENKSTEREFIRLCHNMSMNTRMHIHCGHTPSEIFGNQI